MHAPNAPPSTLHCVLVGDPPVVKPKDGVASLVGVGSIGPLVNATVGASVSIVHVYEAGVASVLPAASLARTWNVCAPSPSDA
jgi:hypothetical protein